MEPGIDNSTQFSPPAKTSESFRDLPPELQLLIVEYVFTTKPPCLRHLFSLCCDQWSCESGYHPSRVSKSPYHPDPSFSNITTLFYEEGHKYYYRHNVFVFNQSPPLYRDSFSMVQEIPRGLVSIHDYWRLARDPGTLGFLNFVDDPPSAPGISDTIHPPRVLQRFAKQVRHLVLCVDNNVWPEREIGWEWPLMVDWTTLPDLETLCIDLRSYSRRELSAIAESQGAYESKLATGAKLMECLDLKRLTLVGLCSGAFYENKSHRQRVKKLFSSSVAKRVDIEFWDWPDFVHW